MKYVSPSVRETAFNCAHCGVLTTQFWYSLRADARERNKPKPAVFLPGDNFPEMFEVHGDASLLQPLVDWAEEMSTGRVYMEAGKDGNYNFQHVYNVNLSKCYNCKEVSIWVHDRLVHPRTGQAPAPNPDMPQDVRLDYEEASTILDLSPRGAAALIRLAIQKLCKHLGQPGNNINDDIGALVKKGLDVRVQQALDAVRVIGNSAVHPGKIDLRDDRATAEALFRLLNLIVDKSISEPKHVAEVYASLPKGALGAIEKRDERKECKAP